MKLGLGLGLTSVAAMGRRRWSPASLSPLFWAGSFDPASGRMWQDSAGVTPVTTFGQPVGRMLSSVGSIAALQATALSRPTTVRWPKGGRRNLLTWSEDLSQPGWFLVNGATRSGNTITGISSSSYVQRDVTFPAGVPFSAYVESSNATSFTFGGQGLTPSPVFNLIAGTVSGGSTWTNISIVPFGLGYIVSATPTSGGVSIRLSPGVADVTVHWVQVGALPYQKVTTAFDVTEAGVPDVWHLLDDGGDSLPAVFPAGSLHLAYVNQLGAVSYSTATSDGTTGVDLLLAERMADVIVLDRAFTSDEEAKIEAYWARYAA